MDTRSEFVWFYWAQGFDASPYLVKRCYESWKKHNSDRRVIFLDDIELSNLKLFTEEENKVMDKLSLPHKSDLIRLKLLIEYGGTWVDSTVFCLKPLSDWCTTERFPFFFKNNKRDRIISNWFINVEADSDILRMLYDRLLSHWNKVDGYENSYFHLFMTKVFNAITSLNLRFNHLWFRFDFLKLQPYFIFHYELLRLLTENEHWMLDFKRRCIYSADGPHYFHQAGFDVKVPDDVNLIRSVTEEKMLKLNWRTELDPSANSFLYYIFSKF